jgi:DNA-3-methyladenine glycosylase
MNSRSTHHASRITLADLLPLPRSFYAPSAEVVAPLLLGHFLIRNTPAGPCGGIIVETEAYLANDPACHGYRRETPRNRSMYGPPGHAYVYFIYGNHYCFNTVCSPPGVAEAVLVRAIEPALGEEIMRSRRPVYRPHDLGNGPAKLCVALDIDRRLDGVDLCAADSPIWVARNPDLKPFLRARGPRITTPRVGLTQAADLPLRFCLAGSLYVSRR